jgi:hypothetical protein
MLAILRIIKRKILIQDASNLPNKNISDDLSLLALGFLFMTTFKLILEHIHNIIVTGP